MIKRILKLFLDNEDLINKYEQYPILFWFTFICVIMYVATLSFFVYFK